MSQGSHGLVDNGLPRSAHLGGCGIGMSDNALIIEICCAGVPTYTRICGWNNPQGQVLMIYRHGLRRRAKTVKMSPRRRLLRQAGKALIHLMSRTGPLPPVQLIVPEPDESASWFLDGYPCRSG